MIAALLLLFATPQAATVTFTHPCAHSSVVLAAFGKQIGETIKPTGSVLKDYFLVRFGSMPVEDAKKAIARALSATWTRDGDVVYLTRTRAQEVAEENAIADAFKKAVQREIDDARADVAKYEALTLASVTAGLKGKSDGIDQTYSQINEPIQRLRQRITASLSVDDVLKSPIGITRYSNKPGLDDFPFTPTFQEIYKTFLLESDIWWTAEDASNLGQGGSRRSDIAGKVGATASFEFSRDGHSFDLSFQFTLDNAGSSMGRGGAYALYEFDNQWYKFIKDIQGKPKIDDATREAWNEQKPSEGFFRTGMRLAPMRKRKNWGSIYSSIARDVIKNEPLSVLVSWPIIQAAESKSTNIVAVLPDSLIGWLKGASIEQDTSLGSLFTYATYTMWANYDDSLKCWLAHPLDNVGNRKYRLNRDAFAGLIVAATQNGWTGLDDFATYIRKNGFHGLTESWFDLLTMAEGAEFDDEPSFYYRDVHFATKLYAAISDVQRRAAWNGGTEIPVSQWPTKILELLKNHDWSQDRFALPGTQLEDYPSNEGRRVSAVMREKLHFGTVLRVKVDRTNPIWVSSRDSGYASTVEGIAANFVDSDSNPKNQRYKGFAIGTHEQLTIELAVPNVGTTRLMRVFEYTPFVDELVPFDKLPTRVQDAVRAEMKRIRGGG